jgi:hypothetical protein
VDRSNSPRPTSSIAAAIDARPARFKAGAAIPLGCGYASHATLGDVGTYLRLECAGPSIRAVLAEVAPDELVDFEAEFRCALAEADDNFDLSRVQAVINKWWGRAHLRLHPRTADELAAVARVAAGDETGMHTRTVGGHWVQH